MKSTAVAILSLCILILGAFMTEAKSPERSEIEAFIANPFGVTPEPTNINKQIRGCVKVDKDPIKNEYHQGQFDTIYTINKRKSSVGVYKRGEDHIFYQADINNRKVKLRDNIYIGMKVDELNKKLPGLQPNDDGVLSYANIRGDKLLVYTCKGKIKRIYIERYIE